MEELSCFDKMAVTFDDYCLTAVYAVFYWSSYSATLVSFYCLIAKLRASILVSSCTSSICLRLDSKTARRSWFRNIREAFGLFCSVFEIREAN